MSTDLRQRLAALADAAATVDPNPPTTRGAPGDLWRRGRRRQVRRALATTVAVAVVSVVIGIGGATAWQRVERAGPVNTPDDTMRLPDHLYTPSPWLDGTDDAGPIGPLVAVIGAERRSWWSISNGLVGVSAGSGEYRFLDLPDMAILSGTIPGAPALSPDGTMLAYWITGPTTAEPLLQLRGDRPVAGVAVYDTVTGEMHRKAVVSDHGLQPNGIAWSGDTVWVTYFAFNEGGVEPDGYGSTFGGELTWSPGAGDWSTQTDFGKSVGTAQAAIGTESFVMVAPLGKGYVEVRPSGEFRRFRLDVEVENPPHLSPSGNRVAGIKRPDEGLDDNSPRKFLVAELGPSGTVGPAKTSEVPGVLGGDVLGWRDEEHVIVGLWGSSPGYVSVDIATGASELLGTPPEANYTPGMTVAADAWGAPVVQAPEPDWPTDPRLVALVVAPLVALSVAAGTAALWMWRRRRGHT